MLPNEINEICKAAFINLVKSDSQFHGRTYCFMEPYESRSKTYHITLVDKATGFGVVVPLAPRDIPFMDKEIVQRIMSKVLIAMVNMVKSKPRQGQPVDYQTHPITANGRQCRLDSIERCVNVTVEVYTWSRLIIR
jgi:hypothetical protein